MTAEQKAEIARCDREIEAAEAQIATCEFALIGASDWRKEKQLILAESARGQE